MEFLTVNGKRYIALGDFDHLRRGLIKDIRDKYTKGEDGQIHMTPEDVGSICAYSHIMVEMLKDDMHEICGRATSPEELRNGYDELYDSIRDEWMRGKYCIVAKDGETGERLYFRKWCDQADPEKDETPVFSTLKRDAMTWNDHYYATLTLERLRRECAFDDLRIVPLYMIYASKQAHERLLNAIFGDEDKNDVGRWVIRCDPLNEEDGIMLFSQWIRYHEDMPEPMKQVCKECGMALGDRRPMFVSNDDMAMVFVHRGMAEKTVEKIIELYPEWDGKLHVEEAQDNEQGEG